MARSLKGAVAAALAATALVLGTTAAQTPASAATVPSAGGFFYACYPWHDSHTGGGWCDGQGPDWTYQATAICQNSAGQYWGASGVARWAGDRRGSYAYCSTLGGTFVYGYLNVYDNGQFVYQYSE